VYVIRDKVKQKAHEKENVMERMITGKTGLMGLIGSPVGHSGSPAMYNYSFEKLGLDYAYLAFDVKVDGVEKAIEAVKTFKMRGCNVTMPCKNEALKYMDELSPAARIIGAVNTIVNEDGKLVGHITDGQGFVDSLKDEGIDIAGKKITVCGGGGAATAIQVQCALEGAREISIFNIKDEFFDRTVMTAEKIKEEKPGCVVNVFDIADQTKMKEEMDSSDIFTNATIVGMKPMDQESVVKDPAMFHQGLVVVDAVYNPKETKMLREAKEAGCICINGQGMLLWQGAAAFKLYTGLEMPVQEVKTLFFS
jgi:shikimate dehydrogenase